MANQNSKQSFWTTFPGILTGCAAVITAIATLLGALYTLGAFNRAPTPAPLVPRNGNDPGSGSLFVNVVSEPASAAVGEKVTIYVTVLDGKQHAVDGARVNVSAGGGMFLPSANTAYDPNARLMGPFSAAGYTGLNGVFTTWWVCSPCAPGYGMNISATKDGYEEGLAEWTIEIH